jgi:hypothetical protein
MVIRTRKQIASRRAYLMMELLVAIAILTGALIPLAYSLVSEKQVARRYYQRAVAAELVDGELEVLAAGAWRAFPEGVHPYSVRAGALTNLPPGKFVLTIKTGRLRLEWLPGVKDHGGPLAREAVLK